MCWGPAVFQTNRNTGTKSRLWQIKIGGDYQNSIDNHAVVDHLKVDGTSYANIDYVFGTTRTRYYKSTSDSRKNIYIFRLQSSNKNTHVLDNLPSEVKVSQLDASSSVFPVNSFVTGIYDKLETSAGINANQMHLVWFSPTTQELYYMRCDFTSTSATSILLYTGI